MLLNDAAAHAAMLLLAYGVLPIWIIAGVADYFCHRASRIQDNSGTRESLLHLLQFSLVGLPVMLAMFLEPNAGFFLLGLICILLHHAVAYIDVAYANHTRRVSPFEQMVHSVLEIAPIGALLLLAIIAWSQFLALFGVGPEHARFTPRLRPLPIAYVATIIASAILFNLLPYLEELWRCLRHGQIRRQMADRFRHAP